MDRLQLLARAINYIEMNLKEQITAETVANACYCSKSHLQKLFKYANGYSVKEYIIKRRMTNAARDLVDKPSDSILEIAYQYGYQSPEAFTRAFEQVWKCKPSTFRREARFTQLYPRQRLPQENGDPYMNDRKQVDIQELYDLFVARSNCYFVCCDIKSLIPINEISRKAGDLAILELLHRMEEEAGPEDVIFRIGGDEFVLLTSSQEERYARGIADRILQKNEQTFTFENLEIPLSIYASVTKYQGSTMKYDELFVSLHTAIKDCK